VSAALPDLYRPSLALLTDLYQLTMAAAAWKSGVAADRAVFTLSFRRNPFQGGFTIAAGLGPVLEHVARYRFDESDLEFLEAQRDGAGAALFERDFLDALRALSLDVDVDAVPEGTAVFPWEPLLRLRGPIISCMLLETPLLAIVNFQTLIATKAARMYLAARGKPVLEFGLRRAQGFDGGLSASRAAYLGGAAATSNVLAGKLFGIPVKGTHAHSWVMLFDDERAAFQAYAAAMPHNCVLLVDTYDSLEGVRRTSDNRFGGDGRNYLVFLGYAGWGPGQLESEMAQGAWMKPGDRAAYCSGPPGSYSHARVMPAKTVVRLPDAISFETGAAMMLKGLTVQYLLKRVRAQEALEPGDFVVWHAAAGGVGLIACQWAKALGLKLIGTAGSDEKCALARDNGAAFTINYRSEDFAARVKEITGGKGVKVVYDSVGKDTWDKSLDCLSPFGLMASFGNASGPVPPFAPGILGAKGSLYVTRQTLFTHIATRDAAQEMADDLFGMVTSGKVKIHIDQRYPLEQVQKAHRDLEARKTTGCTILTL
jgi:NADPH2:quinone reductase